MKGFMMKEYDDVEKAYKSRTSAVSRSVNKAKKCDEGLPKDLEDMRDVYERARRLDLD